MNLLDAIASHAAARPEALAYRSPQGELTYRQLWEGAGRLAAALDRRLGENRAPLVVYGHKGPLVPLCFLACARSGRGYCPVDTSLPPERVARTVEAADPPLVLAAEPLADPCGRPVLAAAELAALAEGGEPPVALHPVEGEDLFYILFTSGSTGTPKGVQITADCLDHFLDWSSQLGEGFPAEAPRVFLNQAPFSFDLSVMDLYTAFYTGGTLWTLPKEVQQDAAALFSSLEQSGAQVWVSTPSFAEVCLADRRFDSALLPDMKLLLFCGETLQNATVQKLHSRFPGAKVINTYGPTESTVAVTQVEITPALAAADEPLPVGAPKPGTWLLIAGPEGEDLPEGERGEIVIVGDTVSSGYFGRPDLTARAFGTRRVVGGEYRLYRTGDKGYLRGGQLHYCGPLDLQIKLHGYRIELEDIEQNICRLPGVRGAVVLPQERDGAIRSLTAYVAADWPGERGFAASQRARGELAQFLPAYMIPKKFVFLDALPMTANGKVDRKALGGLAR